MTAPSTLPYVQMQKMVGDLYPTASEKSLIFTGIELHCAPPHNKSGHAVHWDDWKDSNGKKHKGSGVDAVEKARREPEKWGLDSNAVVDGQPPPALPGTSPHPSTHLSTHLSTPPCTFPLRGVTVRISSGLGAPKRAMQRGPEKVRFGDAKTKRWKGSPPPLGAPSSGFARLTFQLIVREVRGFGQLVEHGAFPPTSDEGCCFISTNFGASW